MICVLFAFVSSTTVQCSRLHTPDLRSARSDTSMKMMWTPRGRTHSRFGVKEVSERRILSIGAVRSRRVRRPRSRPIPRLVAAGPRRIIKIRLLGHALRITVEKRRGGVLGSIIQ